MNARRTETGLGLPDPRLFERNVSGRRASIRRAFAIAALLGAPLAGVAGALLDVDTLLAYPAPFVAYAANALLLAVIPLLLLGAFLLDTLEDDVARRRAARQDDDDKRPGLRLVLPPASD